MKPIHKRPRFLIDLAEELTCLKDNAGPQVAAQWYDALQRTIEQIRRHPLIGRERSTIKTAMHP
jgi:plasmid stabilization system protein ParE